MINKENYLTDDCKFNELLLPDVRKFAARHWTPFEIIDLAVDFLAEKDSSILDIGSGVGKFCLAGAYYAPHAFFYGVEQRHDLAEYAIKTQKRLKINNAFFIKGNFTQLNLREFDHFYFFNSFFENLEHGNAIDENIELSPALFDYYSHYLHTELQKLRKGTRIVTYHSILEEIPNSYELVESDKSNDLNFWIKQ
jgi:Methyltransferase domain